MHVWNVSRIINEKFIFKSVITGIMNAVHVFDVYISSLFSFSSFNNLLFVSVSVFFFPFWFCYPKCIFVQNAYSPHFLIKLFSVSKLCSFISRKSVNESWKAHRKFSWSAQNWICLYTNTLDVCYSAIINLLFICSTHCMWPKLTQNQNSVPIFFLHFLSFSPLFHSLKVFRIEFYSLLFATMVRNFEYLFIKGTYGHDTQWCSFSKE